VWFKPPGWRPADVAARWPKPAFDIQRVQRYDPPTSPRAAALAVALFVAVLAGHQCLPVACAPPERWPSSWPARAALVAALWAIGALTQPRGATEPRPDTMAVPQR
jgi:hypothetical protein